MRISMSLPKDLLNEFDEVINDRGYQSRSKGIRDALKDYILRYRWMNEMEGEYMGTLSIIYNPHYMGVMENLNDIQESFSKVISAAMHFHVDKNRVFEIIVVKGDIKGIRNLSEKIMRLKGVEHVKLSSTATEKSKNP
ncbi:nickel responsive regulator [Methanobacterium sp. MB1]|nr:nickel responsive regulator [Methanobacterium sp. MB1]